MTTVPFTGLAGPTLSTAHIELSESTYSQGLEQPLHSHDPVYFTVVLAGAYHERTGRTSRHVSAGALLFHEAGETHAVRFLARSTRVFRLRPLAPMLEAERLARASFGATIEHAPAARSIVAELHATFLNRDVLAPLISDALACELVACCALHARNGAVDHDGAIRAREIIESQLSRTPSLEALAIEAGCHPITLARAFRRSYGCSIGEYIRRRRVEEAARMLRQTDIPISAVALRTGFSDQAHLTRSMRRATGRTPGALRAFKTA